MMISKKTPLNHIEIWSQRYHDRTVLMASWKIGMHNKITFKNKSRGGYEYYMSGEKIRSYPTEMIQAKTGNMVTMYAVPIDDLELLEYKEDIAEIALNIFDH